MMLSQRVSTPLVGLARLIEDWEEVGASMGQAGDVLNRPLEDAPAAAASEIRAPSPSTTLPSPTPAPNCRARPDRLRDPGRHHVGPGRRSGSGKSTITRLLQGINREYSGFIKIDGADLREINLRHLRSSFGVVLQENFLFRGSIRDNILAGRPGLTLEDAIRAARLAGARNSSSVCRTATKPTSRKARPTCRAASVSASRSPRADHRPRILILDEATSALDPESEALVNANLLRIARGRTMLIVSHAVLAGQLRPDPGAGPRQAGGYRTHAQLLNGADLSHPVEPAKPSHANRRIWSCSCCPTLLQAISRGG